MDICGNGVQASAIQGARWVKAARSNAQGNCVEVAMLPEGEVAVRNSRFPDGPALVYTHAEMDAFVEGVKNGEFDFVID
ncbi:DUF397 domain-containing protein [Streptomyces sp. NPDC054796]